MLHAISSFDDAVLDHSAGAVVQGLTSCIASSGPLRSEITNSPDFWSILQRLHQHKTEAAAVFEILQKMASAQPSAITADNYESTVALAHDFAAAGSIGSLQEQRRDLAARRGRPIKPNRGEESSVVGRAVQAINIIYQLTGRIRPLIEQSHLERREAWAAYWSPIFRALTSQCVNPCREVRFRALSALQRALLSEDLASEEHTEWTAIFGEVLFPLIIRLLKPEVYQIDPAGMGETRVQAATLVCKIFLRYLDHLVECRQMLDVWLRILDLLERMMGSGAGSRDGEALAEAVPESLKNILLVMAGGEYLRVPGPGAEGDVIWTESKKRLDRFLPGLLDSLFPVAPEEPEEPEGPVTKATTAAGGGEAGGGTSPNGSAPSSTASMEARR